MTNHPTLLRMPPWLGISEVAILPGDPEDYEICQLRPDWLTVIRLADGKRVYTGIGPVEVSVRQHRVRSKPTVGFDPERHSASPSLTHFTGRSTYDTDFRRRMSLTGNYASSRFCFARLEILYKSSTILPIKTCGRSSSSMSSVFV